MKCETVSDKLGHYHGPVIFKPVIWSGIQFKVNTGVLKDKMPLENLTIKKYFFDKLQGQILPKS